MIFGIGLAVISTSVPVGRPVLGFSTDRDALRLTWSSENGLEEAMEVDGPWSEVSNAISPRRVETGSSRRFYRLRQR
jgi:hypothetical protein